MIEIKSAREDDMPAILEIEREAIAPPWTHGALLAEIYRNDSFFALAVEDGVTLGFCILRRVADDGELFQIAVDKSVRRRGTGSLLLSSAFESAEESGLERIFLEVRTGNGAAIAFYLKHGFIQAGKRKNYYNRPVEDALIMVKELRHNDYTFS